MQVQEDQRRAGAQLRRNSTCAGGVQQLSSVCVDLVLHKARRIQNVSLTRQGIAEEDEHLQLDQSPQIRGNGAYGRGEILNRVLYV